MAERVDPQDQPLQTVITKIRNGQWRIPRFQRNFVWTPDKLSELLDSITKAYPIGSIVVWEVDDKHRDSFRPLPELDQPEKFERDLYFVLDGQQRCTALAAAFLGKSIAGSNFRHVCYDLDARAFVVRDPDDISCISIEDVLSPNLASNRVMDRILTENPTRYRDLINIKELILHYRVPVVTVRDQRLESVAEAFTRLNMSGTKLTVFDLVCARVWSSDFDLRERFQVEIAEPMEEWDDIDGTLVIQAAALHLKGDSRNTTMVELPADDLKALWPKLVKSVAAACDWLMQMGVLSGDRHLPFAQMLSVLAAFDLSEPLAEIDADTQKRLERWFWTSSFHDRYRASTLDVMRYDLAWLKREQLPDASSLKVTSMENVRGIDERLLVSATFKKSSSFVKAYLAMLLHEKPRDIATGTAQLTSTQAVSAFKKKEKHHIFPSHLYGGRHNVDSLMNCCFLGAAINKKVGGSRKPSEYLPLFNHAKSDLEKILASNLIPTGGSGAIFRDDFPAFLLDRATIVARRINELCGVQNLPAVGEKLPEVQELVRRTELALRNYIKERLPTGDGATILEQFPTPVRAYLAQRLKKSDNPDDALTLDPEQAIQMLEVKHLEMITTAKKNQSVFTDFLKSDSGQVSNLFRYFGELRNAVQHHREQGLDEAAWSLGIGAAKELLRRSGQSLSATTVPQEISPGERPDSDSGRGTDRGYWEKRVPTDILKIADGCMAIINEASDSKHTLNYKRQYIGLTDGLGPRNFVWMTPRRKYLYLSARPAEPSAWTKKFAGLGLEFGVEQDYLWLTLTPQKFIEHEQIVREFLRAITAEYHQQ